MRLGYMPNLTHAQAVLGAADGTLEQSAGVRLEPRLFHSGPTAMTALFAGEIDVAYVGPSPAVNAFVRSGGKAVRVVAGGASGGAVFVVRPGVDPQRLEGARLASPGVANTQDVALRHLLMEQGVRTRERGGKASLTPLPPAEIISLFDRGLLDGAWVAEPWGARLMQEAGGLLVYDERELWPDRRFATTVIVVATDYLARNPEAVRGLLQGHEAITEWIRAHPGEARERLQAELAVLQGRPLPDTIMTEAMSRIDFVTDPMVDSVLEQAQRAWRMGYLGAREPDLSDLFDLRLWQEVVR